MGQGTCPLVPFINKSNRFKIHFPDGEEDWVNKGITIFKNLPNVIIIPWKGMADSIEISGQLSNEIKDIFIKYQSQAFKGEHPDLWDFQFYLDDEILLYVGDFTTRVVSASDQDLLYFKQKGIDVSKWM